MKRLITATALTTAVTLAHATPLYHPPGPNLTYGAVSNGQTIMSDITNPAAGAAVLKKDGNQYRFGILGSVGAGIEFGKIDDLYNKIDAQADIFSNGALIDETDFTGTINSQVDAVNSVLREVGSSDAYAKGFVSAHVPLMPLVVAHKALGGSIVLDINASAAVKVHALNTDVIVDAAQLETDILAAPATPSFTNGDVTIDNTDPFNPVLTIDNDSSVIAKASTTSELALGYSRPMMELGGGTLYAGLRGRYHEVGLARAAIRLGTLIDGAEQAFEDAADEDFVTDTALGLDLGVLWINEHFRLGATMANINQPEFEFGDISTIGSYTDAGVIKQIRDSNNYTLEKQLTVEAAIYTKSQNWVISAAVDTNAIEDALGDEYQWGTVSAAYATDTWFLPGIRAGLRQNLAGTKVKYLTGGVTMGPVNLDLAYSPDEVTIDGETVPRGAMLNLGLEVSF